MRRIMLVFALGLVASLLVAAPAAGLTTVPPGHFTETVTCEDLGEVTVSVQRGEGWGSVQLVGANGHFIVVGFEFTLLNLTQETTVFSETDLKGKGNAHRNQETTTCSLVFFEGPASDLELEPGEELPPDVAPTDILRGELSVTAILKAR